jgi:hypothetical protein
MMLHSEETFFPQMIWKRYLITHVNEMIKGYVEDRNMKIKKTTIFDWA